MQKLIAIILLLIPSLSFSQTSAFTNDNKIYIPNIKTVLCYNSAKEQSIPLIVLNSSEKISFSFDDLLAGTNNYWYTIEHYTSDWQPSRISTIDYLDGFNEDRIIDYRYSSNTSRKYTHYELTLPNTQIQPKISGNYLLKVYLNGDKNKPVISQRFYILDNQMAVTGEITNSLQVEERNAKQKINFTINHSIPIANPYQDIKAFVMQNFDQNTIQLNTKPAFIRPNQLVFNDLNTNDFWGTNEFRKFDTRSLRYKGENVKDIYRDNESVNVMLFQDAPRNNAAFGNQVDENGNFFVRNTDGRDDRSEAEYMSVVFTLNASAPSPNGEAYVVGRFNSFNLNKENKLLYDAGRKQFYGNLMLKQGLYDYEYVWLNNDAKNAESRPFEGSFFQTENSYQIFVYYRRPGSRWDTLVGYTNLSTKILDRR